MSTPLFQIDLKQKREKRKKIQNDGSFQSGFIGPKHSRHISIYACNMRMQFGEITPDRNIFTEQTN